MDWEPNPNLAEEYMRQACHLNDSEACWTLSTWYMGSEVKFKNHSSKNKRTGELKRDTNKAIEYAIRACEADVLPACINLARIFKLGDGVPKNQDREKEFVEKSKLIQKNIKEGWTPEFTA